MSQGALFCYGNPLLDIIADVSEEFLKKYELESNNAILAEEKHQNLFSDLIKSYDVEYVAGGAVQNSCRVIQWLLEKPNVVTFVGCVGNDKFGEILKDRCQSQGVYVKYQVTDKEPTGTCAALINGKNRSLVANLAAANLFNKSHIDIPENRLLMEEASFYYCSGFVLTVSPETVLTIGKLACENNKPLAMNLSAPFLLQFFKDRMLSVLPYVDILFGNETEALTFAKENNLQTEDLKDIAKKLSNLPKENNNRQRIVVITQGPDPVILCNDGIISEYPVIPLSNDDIVDTNGAGDAFVGGFLAEFIHGKSLSDCIRCANYAANYIIQRSGVTLHDKPNYKM